MNRKKWFKKSVALLLTFCMTLGLMTQWGQLTSNADSGYTELTFSDFGIANQVITGVDDPATAIMGPNATVNANGLDKIAITGYITLDANASSASYIQFGNMLQVVPANTNQFGFWKIGTGWIGWSNDLGQAIAGEKIKIRFEFDASGDDYVLKTYINDNEAAVVTISGGVSAFTWRDLCFGAEKGKTLSVESYTEPQEPAPIEYTELTFSDFGIANQVITGKESESTTIFGNNATVNANGLNKIAFTGYLTFAQDCTMGSLLQFGNMMQFMPNNEKQFGALNIEAGGWAGWTSDVGETIVGTKIKLRLEFDVNGNDYVMKTYVNDIPSGTITISNGVNSFTWRDLCLIAETGKTLSIESYTESQEPTPIEYKELTLGDFGIADDTYTTSVTGTPTDATVTTFDKVAITATLNYAEDTNSQVRIGGVDADGWSGPITLFISGGKLYAWNYIEPTKSLPLTDIALREQFTVRMEFVYDGDDVKVTYYVNNMESPIVTAEYTDYKDKFAPRVLLYATDSAEVAVGAGSELTPPKEPIVQKTPEELGYAQISLPHFTMGDGEYAPGKVSSDHWYDVYQEGDSVSNKYLDVNVTFKGETLTSDGASIRYASANGWEGISIAVEGNVLRIFNPSVGGGYDYTLEELGITSFDEAFNLKLGVILGEKYETGEQDLTFCLWVKDILIEKDAKLSKVKGVGNGMGIYTPKNVLVLSTPDSVVVADKGELKQLPTDFRKVTFQSFEIEDGKYTYKKGKLADEGSWVLPMNKTLFSGDICFSSIVGADFRYGGAQNAWCGLYFYTAGGVDGKSDGKLYMNLVAPEATDNPSGLVLQTPYVFKPYTVGMDLVDNWMNLKITTEFVDSDKDGKTDDVKLGVWFNDVLYDNEYIYLKDFAKHLGNYAGISVSAENSHIQVRKDTTVYTGVDYSLFGFTDNWVKEFGL